MNRIACFLLVLFGGVVSAATAAPSPVLYLPLDDSLQAAVSSGAMTPKIADSNMTFHPGLRGGALALTGDLRWKTAGCFNRDAGTIAFWIRPTWDGTDKTSRSLFSLYGSRDLKEPWLTNRYSIVAGGGQLSFWICGETAEQKLTVHTSIADWRIGQWHYVAVSWLGINSHGAAEAQLYIDGKSQDRKSAARLDVGPVAEMFDIGRDSDNSPDYADADYDEFYIYGQALQDSDISRAVDLSQRPAESFTEPAPSGKSRVDWWNDAWPLRCRVTVPLVDSAGGRTIVRLPLDLANDLRDLGLTASVDAASLRIVPCDGSTGSAPSQAAPLACALDNGVLSWRLPSDAVPGKSMAFEIYFDVIALDCTTPLYGVSRRRDWRAAVSPALVESDYARETYGKAWDFNKDDDFEGIDDWGSKPEFVKNRQVKNGVLSFDAVQDGYFIWGSMWSEAGKTHRPVAIDLKQYPILKMRVRQSCRRSTWQLYARAENTLDVTGYKFPVTGTQWQTLRVDLRHEAGWSGVLKAFRIGPAWKSAGAHVDIDWVSLTNELPAQRSAVEMLGRPAKDVASLSLSAAVSAAPCKSIQTVTAIARDASGAPLAGAPVTLRLASNCDGELLAAEMAHSLAVDARTRRAITDAAGAVTMRLQSSRLAAPRADVLSASADFRRIAAAAVVVGAVAGAPDHYAITPKRASTIDESKFPLAVHVQVVDAYDNPLPVGGKRVRLSAEGARLDPAEAVTGADGGAEARLTVDSTKQWVYQVEAADSASLAGQSGMISLALKSPRPAPIHRLENGYFARGVDQPFVPLGGFYANWVQLETPDGEWSIRKGFAETTDEQKLRWMQFLHDNGATAMRLMLRSEDEPMDIGGRVNQALLAKVLHYMDLARRFDLQFQIVLHNDYTTPIYFNGDILRTFALPMLAADEPVHLAPEQERFLREMRLITPIKAKYSDPDAMACQDRYIRELLPALRNCPQLFSYELENEMVACPASWAQHALATIREVDPLTPACVSHGGGGLLTADPLWWHRNVPLDFYTYHLYPQEHTTSAEIDYGAAVDVLARYGRMAGTCFMGESSGDQFAAHPSVLTRRRVMRDIIWMALTKGNPGVFFWNARGPEVREFRMAKQAMAQLDLAHFHRIVPEIGIDVRHPLEDDRWFSSPAGRAAYAMMGQYAQHYLAAGVDFDFTLSSETYASHADLTRLAPPEPQHQRFTPPAGWQLSYLAGANYDEMLVYVRNYAGSKVWKCNYEHNDWTQYLRECSPAPLKLSWTLPGAGYTLTLYDLENQQITTRDAAATDTLDLGTTDRDYVLVFKRR